MGALQRGWLCVPKVPFGGMVVTAASLPWGAVRAWVGHSPELAGGLTALLSPPENTTLLSSHWDSPAMTPSFFYDYFLQSSFRFIMK